MELNNEEKLEMVIKLSSKANVSMEDSRKALDACSWDMLDAMVYLEKLGKTSAPMNESYSTKGMAQTKLEEEEEDKSKKVTAGDIIGKFFKWCGKIIKIGNENFLDVDKDDENFISIPLTLVVVLLLFVFWIFVPLLVVGLFFGYKYGFTGPLFKKDDVFNATMNKVSEATETIKNEVKDEFKDKQ